MSGFPGSLIFSKLPNAQKEKVLGVFVFMLLCFSYIYIRPQCNILSCLPAVSQGKQLHSLCPQQLIFVLPGPANIFFSSKIIIGLIFELKEKIHNLL